MGDEGGALGDRRSERLLARQRLHRSVAKLRLVAKALARCGTAGVAKALVGLNAGGEERR